MKNRTIFAFVYLIAIGFFVSPVSGLQKEEKKEAKEEKRKGKVTGEVTAKGEWWLEVQADGEDKGRKYFPPWRGGLPKDGGGPDKDTIKLIKEMEVDSRIQLEWVFEERARIEKVDVLKKPVKKK
jgi:hypothetical protein